MDHIGVWNTAFLGDAVLTLPLIQALHKIWPKAQIDFYVRGGLESLFHAQPEISHCYPGKGKGASKLFTMAQNIHQRKYDLWISPHTSLRSSFIALASQATQRVGYTEATFSPLCYHHRVSRHFFPADPPKNLDEVERLLGLLNVLKPGSSQQADPWPHLTLPATSLAWATTCLAPLKTHGPVLAIHPGSVWPTKRWPVEHFAHIARQAVDFGASILLLAGPGEEASAHKCLALAGLESSPRILNMAGKTSLLELAAILGQVDVYLTNDSGPMHLAWAQHTPTIALFGPTVQSLGFSPRGPNSQVLQVSLPCRPCGLHGHKQCPKAHHHCMTQLRPEMVWPVIHGALQRRLAKSHKPER